ncbi:hypothetical protein [Embleya sp. AB8]|uniref:hypothetical protein n=1 Tax=Embleya sp. AB8 TaxID=3156304 RepID=UPI003C7818DD
MARLEDFLANQMLACSDGGSAVAATRQSVVGRANGPGSWRVRLSGGARWAGGVRIEIVDANGCPVAPGWENGALTSFGVPAIGKAEIIGIRITRNPDGSASLANRLPEPSRNTCVFGSSSVTTVTTKTRRAVADGE